MPDFEVQRADVRGVDLAFIREGVGGFPLLLLHGWPESKRIWWRNIEPLAEAGFEVIAPDLRGYGDSGLAPDDHYDAATQARDMEALLRELGHERCVACGGDFGGVVAQDMSLRFPGLVERMVLFNTIPPVLPDGPREVPREVRMAADYFMRQGLDADGLAAELDTPDKRRRYVAEMYGPRFWAAPGAFEPRRRGLHDRALRRRRPLPLVDRHLRVRDPRAANGPRRRACASRTPRRRLILYGPEDHVIPREFPQRMEEAFTERIGPFLVQNAGHFLQWERADVLNPAIGYFCRDLLGELAAR